MAAFFTDSTSKCTLTTERERKHCGLAELFAPAHHRCDDNKNEDSPADRHDKTEIKSESLPELGTKPPLLQRHLTPSPPRPRGDDVITVGGHHGFTAVIQYHRLS